MGEEWEGRKCFGMLARQAAREQLRVSFHFCSEQGAADARAAGVRGTHWLLGPGKREEDK